VEVEYGHPYVQLTGFDFAETSDDFVHTLE